MNARGVDTSTILVIEDDPRGRDLLGAHLKSLGHCLEFAEDGAEGLRKARELIPDIILSDVMMPGTTGFDVCRAVRSDERLKEVPILLITALDDRESRLAGIEAGADEFISKPFDGQELRARIRLISKLNRFRGILAEKDKFQRVVDLAPNAIFVVNARLEIEFANNAANELFGASDGLPLVGTRFPFLIEALPFATFNEELFAKVNRTGRFVRFTGSFIRLNNERFPAEGSVGPFSWNKEPAVQVNLADVSSTQRLEKELVRSQRLHGLGSIAGGIAHDLNNVLTPVLMAAEALRSHVDSEEGDELVSMIVAAGKRGASLVKQVLTFARGRHAEMAPVPLRLVVNEVRRLLSESLPDNVRLKVVNASKDVTVIGNSTELIQVVMNLCVNARDAMPEGGTIELRCDEAVDADGGQWARISVIDTGVGMSEELLDRIGKTFFSTKPEGDGTGLGLATVQLVLNHHDAHLKVRSELEIGSTFEAWFPAADPRSSDPDEATVHFVRVHGRGELILICDDDAAIREIAAGAISCHGFEVICAGDGAEATALYSQHQERIAAVITDLKMPYLDGAGVIRSIRRLGGAVPVVLMTTERADELPPDLDGLNAALLSKPFTTTDLLAAVANAVKTVRT